MTSVISALSFGGEWEIHDKILSKHHFRFLKIINQPKVELCVRKNILKITIDSPAAAGAGTLAKALSNIIIFS